ncbi:FtsX-like permease family protein [Streptomyces sp. NPDC050388]|uniref:FtsX-like permease family protein n=1 Tax=Streptomyces sp. NPDC050388 TaxID=3155781 RepID=UPI0034437E0E
MAAGLREMVRSAGGQVLGEDEWVAATCPETNRSTRPGLLPVLGIALLHTGISLVNTMVTATSDRVRDLAVLRLAGVTNGQVLRLVRAESLLVVAVGALLGLAVAALDLTGRRAALGLLPVRPTPVLPWPTIGAVVGACAFLAALASVAPAGLALRRHAVELAGIRE